MSLLHAGRRRRHLILLAILLLAFALRLWDLDARSLWFDEAMEYWDAKSFDVSNFDAMRNGQDPPLFSIILHVWMLVSETEASMRFFSVSCSLIALACLMRLSLCTFGFGVSVCSALIVTFLPSHIRYAQEVGQYAPIANLILLNLLSLDAIMRNRTWQAYALWVLSATAGAYTYYGAIVALVPPIGLTLVTDLVRKEWRSLVKDTVSVLAYFTAVLPLILFFLPVQINKGPTSKAFQINLQSPRVEIEELWVSTQHVISFLLTGWPFTIVPEWIPVAVFIISLGAALISCRARPSAAGTRLLGWLAFTWAAYYIFGRLNLYPYSYRYATILTPLVAIAMASGITFLLTRRTTAPLGAALMLSMLGLSVISLPNRTLREQVIPSANGMWPETSDLRHVAQYWLEHNDGHTPIYVYYGAVPAFRYYLHLARYETHLPTGAWYSLCWSGQSPSECISDNVYYGVWLRESAPSQFVASIMNTLGGAPDRFWIVFAEVFPEEDNRVVEELSGSYRIEASYHRALNSIYLFARR